MIQIVHWRMPDALGDTRYACGTRRDGRKPEATNLDDVTCRRCLSSRLAQTRIIIWVMTELDKIKTEIGDIRRRIG